MSTVNHSAAAGIHPGAYVQSSDPGAVGAGILWVNTTGSAPYALSKRNTGNTGWDAVSAPLLVGDSGSGGTAGLAPAPGSGDAAAGKFLKASGAWAVPSVGGLTTVTNYLSADVTLTTINTFYDGPTVSLAAGTWLLIGTITCVDSATAAFFTAKSWDGTIVTSSTEGVGANGGWPATITLAGIVSPGSTTSYKISVANGTNSTTGKIKAATPTNGAGNNASGLIAVKIG